MGAKKTWHIMHPCLTDREWLLSELRAGKSRRQMCREIGCDAKTLRGALKQHGLSYPLVVNNNEKLSELEKRIK